MSDSPSSSSLSLTSSETVRDIFLWRRKKLSLSVLSVATAIWVLLGFYQFNLVTVVSWISMAISTSLFLYGNLVRLFHKEEPDFSGWEIPEEMAVQTANSARKGIEEGIRWMLQVSAEREWFVFARVVAVLWLLSYIGSFTDLLTLLYIGTVGGMTVPLIYLKYEDKIKRCGEWMKMQTKRSYDRVDEKVFHKIKDKFQGKVKVEEEKKKVEDEQKEQKVE